MAKTINIDELFETEAKRGAINSLNLEDIIWVKGGKEYGFSPKDIDNWKFTGLSNIDFIMNYFHGS